MESATDAAVAVAEVRHTSSLRFIKGSYTSIFGLVPKEYSLESEETREIIQRFDSTDGFTLQLAASDTQRILSMPDETPTVESAPKPLTGKTLRGIRKEGGWLAEILDHDAPSGEETREAQRLVARFAPDASPFRSLSWDESGRAVLNLPDVLKFLGYLQAENLHGEAMVQRSAATTTEEAALKLNASFEMGEGVNRIVVEIAGQGPVVLTTEQPYYREVKIEGNLTIHGHRELPDGRKVPYSLVTPFSYTTSVSPVAAD